MRNSQPDNLLVWISSAGIAIKNFLYYSKFQNFGDVLLSSYWIFYEFIDYKALLGNHTFLVWSIKNSIFIVLPLVCLYGIGKIFLLDSLSHIISKNAELENQIDSIEKNYKAVLQADLQILFSSLGFEHTERITIYKKSKKGFEKAARFASDPRFLSKGRPFYPDGQGIIEQSWRKGKQRYVCKKNPSVNFLDWQQEQLTKFKIPKSISLNLTMRSRQYWSYPIHFNNQRIAILLIESIRGIELLSKDKDKYISDVETVRLGHILERLQKSAPSLANARMEDF